MRTTIWANSIVWSLSPNESFTRSEDRAVHQLLMMILSWVSERERANLIERTKAGLDWARAQGKILGHVGILTGRGSRSCGGRRSDLGEDRGRPGYEQYPKDAGRQAHCPLLPAYPDRGMVGDGEIICVKWVKFKKPAADLEVTLIRGGDRLPCYDGLTYEVLRAEVLSVPEGETVPRGVAVQGVELVPVGVDGADGIRIPIITDDHGRVLCIHDWQGLYPPIESEVIPGWQNAYRRPLYLA